MKYQLFLYISNEGISVIVLKAKWHAI